MLRRPRSLGERLGLQAGDVIVKLNGKQIPDLIAYELEEAQENLVIEVEKVNGNIGSTKWRKTRQKAWG